MEEDWLDPSNFRVYAILFGKEALDLAEIKFEMKIQEMNDVKFRFNKKNQYQLDDLVFYLFQAKLDQCYFTNWEAKTFILALKHNEAVYEEANSSINFEHNSQTNSQFLINNKFLNDSPLNFLQNPLEVIFIGNF